jgi:hypothetical protein
MESNSDLPALFDASVPVPIGPPRLLGYGMIFGIGIAQDPIRQGDSPAHHYLLAANDLHIDFERYYIYHSRFGRRYTCALIPWNNVYLLSILAQTITWRHGDSIVPTAGPQPPAEIWGVFVDEPQARQFLEDWMYRGGPPRITA